MSSKEHGHILQKLIISSSSAITNPSLISRCKIYEFIDVNDSIRGINQSI